ncbi:17251_t:CDS:1 [Funneliformis geosporum]|uniref:7551_t:CDS:1 n=1 Tax=Funneliformis geosporum TaxID=1117311 RepID=A0A9W4WT09_9GLOM|nr:7551_t:CDS:1 [Funneliformis geosporum]CAI2161637.1 17251_t:CDS:1 [Funneliformis geosporum]
MDPEYVNRIQPPPIPPVITAIDLLPARASMRATDINHLKIKYFNGEKAYYVACKRQRDLQGLGSLPQTIVSLTASKLWNSEPKNVKQAYIDMAQQAYETYQQRYIALYQRRI